MRLLRPVFVCLTAVVLLANSVSAGSISDLKKQQSNVAGSASSAKNQLANTRSEKSAAQVEVDAMDEELSKVTEEMFLINDELDKVSDKLAQTKADLVTAEETRATQYEALKQRVRFMYENGITGYMQILFKSASISDFLNRVDYVNQIITYDNTLLTRMKETETLIAQKKDETEKQKREVEVLLSQQETKKVSLEEAKAKKQSLITKLALDEEMYQQQINDLEAESKRIEKLLKDAEAEAARKASQQTVYTGGKIGWPVPSSSRITSLYGYRTHPISKKKEFHGGIDIGASYGSNIVAAEGGTVISAGWSGGYGYAVVISHGNSLSTLYAHCSKLLVSAGATVTRGQVIARIGSTGYSTGNHLHFEVRLNGATQNPMNYVK